MNEMSLFQERLLFNKNRPDKHKVEQYKIRPIITKPAPVKPFEFIIPTINI